MSGPLPLGSANKCSTSVSTGLAVVALASGSKGVNTLGGSFERAFFYSLKTIIVATFSFLAPLATGPAVA